MKFLTILFFCVGAADYLFGNQLGLGKAFEKGFHAITQLLLLMSGYIILAPLIALVIVPVVTPLFQSIGCDPSLFAGILMSSDGGGAVLAQKMAQTEQAGLYNGVIVGSFMGVSVVCTIPMVLINVGKKLQLSAIKGLLVGFLTIPIGCIISGFFARIPIGILFANTRPLILLIAFFLCLFFFYVDRAIFLFNGISFMVRLISLFGLSLAVVQELLGVEWVQNLTPLAETFAVICHIGIFLAGILPFMELLQKLFYPLIKKIAILLQMSETAIFGLVISLANSIPVIMGLNDMNEKDCMVTVAFMTSACFAIGDHLAFSMQFSPPLAMPLMAGKIIAGVLGAIIAWILASYNEKNNEHI